MFYFSFRNDPFGVYILNGINGNCSIYTWKHSDKFCNGNQQWCWPEWAAVTVAERRIGETQSEGLALDGLKGPGPCVRPQRSCHTSSIETRMSSSIRAKHKISMVRYPCKLMLSWSLNAQFSQMWKASKRMWMKLNIMFKGCNY